MFGNKHVIRGLNKDEEHLKLSYSEREIRKIEEKFNVNREKLYLIEVFVNAGVDYWIVGVDIQEDDIKNYNSIDGNYYGMRGNGAPKNLFPGNAKRLIDKETWKCYCVYDYMMGEQITHQCDKNHVYKKPEHIPMSEEEWNYAVKEMKKRLLEYCLE